MFMRDPDMQDIDDLWEEFRFWATSVKKVKMIDAYRTNVRDEETGLYKFVYEVHIADEG